MISGAGMLAFENCQSPEKLVLDAEIIRQARHVTRGIQLREASPGLELIRAVSHLGEFISSEHTYRWFKEELHDPSPVIDRLSPGEWEIQGSRDAWSRAQERAAALLASYPGPALDPPARKELRRITSLAAREAGMEELPPLRA
jgi:trimethylamine--corrinoid protein Co-methyltransferase